jgi:hypothetical protein
VCCCHTQRTSNHHQAPLRCHFINLFKWLVSQWKASLHEVLPSTLVYQKTDTASEILVFFSGFLPVSQWKAILHEVLPATLVCRRGYSASGILVLFHQFLTVSRWNGISQVVVSSALVYRKAILPVRCSQFPAACL